MVDVKPKSIVVTTEEKLSTVHYRAVVDGEPVLYQVVGSTGLQKRPKDWFNRGSQHVFYHAKNLGQDVQWQHIGKQKKMRKKKVSEKQKALF